MLLVNVLITKTNHILINSEIEDFLALKKIHVEQTICSICKINILKIVPVSKVFWYLMI